MRQCSRGAADRRSKGVYGLDDHQHLSYLWGSAQFDPAASTPTLVLDTKRLEPIAATNLFASSVLHVHRLKRGPFREHSPMLYSIAMTVPTWTKTNSGLMKAWRGEVLGKWPVRRHSLRSADRAGRPAPLLRSLSALDEGGGRAWRRRWRRRAAGHCAVRLGADGERHDGALGDGRAARWRDAWNGSAVGSAVTIGARAYLQDHADDVQPRPSSCRWPRAPLRPVPDSTDLPVPLSRACSLNSVHSTVDGVQLAQPAHRPAQALLHASIFGDFDVPGASAKPVKRMRTDDLDPDAG